MNPHQLLAQLDEKECLAFLSKIVQHKSYTETEGEKQLADFMVRQLKELDIPAELAPVVGARVNAIGTWKGEGGGKSLMFNGHLDTNPVSEGWTVAPWEGKVDDKFIYGIGVSNMKAGDAASFCAVRALKRAGVKLKGDVVLTYVVGELQGGVGTAAAIKQGVRADYFINSEPSDLNAVTMHAASLSFTIELTGITRHLSKREESVDAIAAACVLIPRINAMTFPNARTDEHRSVNRGHVGIVHGALGRDLHEWRPPQVSDFVRLRGVARYAPGQTDEDALTGLRHELSRLEEEFPGLKTVIKSENASGRLTMPPFEVDKEARIVSAVNAAYRKVRGVDQPTGAIRPTAFFGTDAGHLHAAGMEGIVCGPGGRYNTMPDERVDIQDYLDMVRIYMLAILEICEPVSQ